MNAVYHDGSLWTSHGVYLPGSNCCIDNIRHSWEKRLTIRLVQAILHSLADERVLSRLQRCQEQSNTPGIKGDISL